MRIDLSFCRQQFPSLAQESDGVRYAFLDGPGGTQVPSCVIEAMGAYLAKHNSNTHGSFITSRYTDSMLDEARAAMADFVGASASEIAFGCNMTTLNYMLSRALGRKLGKGDRVVITDLDHEANRAPWLALQEKGVEVVSVPFHQPECSLDMEEMRQSLEQGARVVAVGYASNGVGTLNDVKTICRWAKQAGAVSVVDAVHYAAHAAINVDEIGCDFLLCSAYKFFGPHVGILYGRMSAFEALDTYRLEPQDDTPPGKIETGTLNHEGIAALPPLVEFICSLGDRYPELAVGQPCASRRDRLLRGMQAIHDYEAELATMLWEALTGVPRIRMFGPDIDASRCPTFSFVLDRMRSDDVARFLAKQNLFVWDGDFYATTLVRRLGVREQGGLVRVGLAPYNTVDEIERLERALHELQR